jgi:hypothetical protein
MRNLRRRIWIDPFQTRLSIRLALYFVLYQIAVWSLFWLGDQLAARNDAAGWPAALVGSVLSPLAAVFLGVVFTFDAVKEAHRIVGPLYRIRKAIEAVAAGEEVSLIKLRAGDHLQELKEDFNAMLRELEKRGAVTLAELPELAAATAAS